MRFSSFMGRGSAVLARRVAVRHPRHTAEGGPEVVSKNVAVIVYLKDGVVDDEVVSALETAGLAVKRVLRRLGMVTGTVPPRGVASLRNVHGVEHVEIDQPVHAAAPRASKV